MTGGRRKWRGVDIGQGVSHVDVKGGFLRRPCSQSAHSSAFKERPDLII